MMIVGADTELGEALARAVTSPDREIRAFVTDPGAATRLKGLGVKVAVGDVSDVSHVAAASTDVFSMVLIATAAHDRRERSFLATPDQVLAGWAEAALDGRVRRVIWVGVRQPSPTPGCEVGVVDAGMDGAVEMVIDLDDRARLE